MKTIPLTKGIFDYTFSLELDEVLYFFRLTYNSRTKIFYLSIRNADKEPILMGVPLVEGANTIRFAMPNLFPGDLLVTDTSLKGLNGDLNSMGDTVQMFYIEPDDTF